MHSNNFILVTQLLLFVAYSIWKKECSEPRCGQMYDLSASCFNSQITNNSYIEIECRDAYGSSDALNLTLTVAGNEKPVLLNLPGKWSSSSDMMRTNGWRKRN